MRLTCLSRLSTLDCVLECVLYKLHVSSDVSSGNESAKSVRHDRESVAHVVAVLPHLFLGAIRAVRSQTSGHEAVVVPRAAIQEVVDVGAVAHLLGISLSLVPVEFPCGDVSLGPHLSVSQPFLDAFVSQFTGVRQE